MTFIDGVGLVKLDCSYSMEYVQYRVPCVLYVRRNIYDAMLLQFNPSAPRADKSEDLVRGTAIGFSVKPRSQRYTDGSARKGCARVRQY